MKILLTIYLSFLLLGVSAQNNYPSYFIPATNVIPDTPHVSMGINLIQPSSQSWMKSHLPVMSIFFVSGILNGMREASSFHWEAFQQTFPKANPEWWNDDISWMNKYEDGDVSKGPDFPGSTTIFVFTTDAYHALTMSDRLCLITGSGLNTYINVKNDKNSIKYYLFDAGMNFVIRSIAFHSVYTILIR